MMKIGIISLVSDVHDPAAVDGASRPVLSALKEWFEVVEIDAARAREVDVPVVLIKTGGTEHKFKQLAPLLEQSHKPFTLLCTGSNNSLPAGMEILSWLNREDYKNSLLLHGPVEMLKNSLEKRAIDIDILFNLRQTRAGVIGRPSDWLIASDVDYEKVFKRYGARLEDISLSEVIETVRSVSDGEAGSAVERFGVPKFKEINDAEVLKAAKVYLALKRILDGHKLTALTLRCFDLLESLETSGCLALSALNDEGIVAGCEGDIPAMFTMLIDRLITDKPSFLANPSRIDTQKSLLTAAHCTVPTSMVESFGYKTHFESGIGVGIAGRFIEETAMTISKIGGDGLDYFYTTEGNIVNHRPSESLCRTQLTVKLLDNINYFLTSPLGNHHIFNIGKHAKRFREVMKLFGNTSV
jgi:L-fucose isomerase-like protein